MFTLSERDLGGGAYELQKRQYYDCDSYGNCRETSWSSWGRWIALVFLLLAAFIFFFFCALFSARRRRAHGQYPIWGTAWIPGTNPSPNNHSTKPNQWQYDPNASTHQPGDPNPPPVYSPPGNYYAPPPGPPPQQYEMQSPYFYGGPTTVQHSPPPGHQETGTYFSPPNSPPPAHFQGGGKA